MIKEMNLLPQMSLPLPPPELIDELAAIVQGLHAGQDSSEKAEHDVRRIGEAETNVLLDYLAGMTVHNGGTEADVPSAGFSTGSHENDRTILIIIPIVIVIRDEN